MNKTFVAGLENHDVYLINDGKVSFYLNVLKENTSTNITLDIKYRYKNNINNIVSYYEKIDNYNITLVIPIVKIEEEFEGFKSQSNEISLIINYAYKLLTTNGLFVNNNINIIKHNSMRSDFIDFFINKFASRVRYLTLDNLVQEEVPYNKIDAANISFVIGKPELGITIKEDDMKEIIKETREKQTTYNKDIQKPKYSFATSGYVSYYLLGFLTAVVTLLMLTLLIK